MPVIKDTLQGDASIWDRQDQEASLLRAQALIIPMKAFIQKCRLSEGFVSKAQATRGETLQPGTQQYTQHMLSRSNYEANLSQIRVSRHAAWAFHIKEVHNRANPTDTKSFQIPHEFRSSGCMLPNGEHRDYQAILYKRFEDYHVGVVVEVYRGAAARLSKKTGAAPARAANTRLMTTSKPVRFPLKASCTSRLKVAPLSFQSDSQWHTSNVLQGVLMDPFQPDTAVYGEFKVKRVLQEIGTKLILELPASTQDIVRRFQVALQGLFSLAIGTRSVDGPLCVILVCWTAFQVVRVCASTFHCSKLLPQESRVCLSTPAAPSHHKPKSFQYNLTALANP